MRHENHRVPTNLGRISAIRKICRFYGVTSPILEDRGGEIVLKPGVVPEVQLFSDERIAGWGADDALAAEERGRLVGELGQPGR